MLSHRPFWRSWCKRRCDAPAAAAPLSYALAMVMIFAAPACGETMRQLGREIAVDEPHLPEATPRVGPIRRGADGQIELIDPTAEKGSAERPCAKSTICVGKDQAYTSLTAALAVAREGDTIEIVAGTYRETARIALRRVTIRGISGVPHFDCAGLRLAADKGCFVLAADEITLDNIEISGAELPESTGANGACVRNESNVSFTLRHIVCHGSQNGILSDGGTILIENSEFFDNGWNDLTHNVYFSGNCTVTVRGSTFRDARIGHEFKSRCTRTIISDSTFRSTKGSRDLDISNGGETLVYRSTLVKTTGTENDEIIAFAPESCTHPGDMVLKEVRIVNSAPQADIRNYDKCGGHPIVLDGAIFEGVPPKQFGYIKNGTGGAPTQHAEATTVDTGRSGEALSAPRTNRLEALAGLVRVMAPGTWREIPGTSIRPVLSGRQEAPDEGGVEGATAVIDDWNGSAYDEAGHQWYFFGGGHQGYSGNEVYRFDLDTLKWTRLTKPSALKRETAAVPCPDTIDGTPLPPHTYDGFTFSPPTQSIFLWGQFPYCRSILQYDAGAWEFSPASRKWRRIPDGPPGHFSGFDPNTGLIAVMSRGRAAWFDPQQRTYSPAADAGINMEFGSGVVIPELKQFWGIDYDRDIFRFGLGMPVPGAPQIVIARGSIPSTISSGVGIAWSPSRRLLFFWGGGRSTSTLDPATLKWAALDNIAGLAPKSNDRPAAARVFSKWKYVKEVDVFVGYNNVDEGVWIYRPP